jgi:predicted acetyltransferase
VRVTVVPALERDKPVIRRLLELNSHDFSEIDGRDLGPHGEYGYRYLDHYWIPSENRHPFLIDVDGRIAGCVLMRAGEPNELGEFFVVRKYRRRGIGVLAARAVFAQFPGAWLIHEARGNDAAVHFWRTAIPVAFDETTDEHGTTQTFLAPHP